MAEVVAEHEGVSGFFEGIVGPSLEVKDPNKAVFMRRAMELLGLGDEDRSEILMVGDRFYDIEAAAEVGVDSVGVLYGYGNERELREAGATYIVKTPAEIVTAVTGEK